MITSMMCSTMTMVMPVSWMRRTSAIASCTSLGVRPASDSSSNKSRGSVASTRAISSRLRPGVPSERAGLVRAQAGQFDDAARLIARIVAVRMAQEGADHHIMKHAHVLEGGRHLEGAADAGACMRLRRRPSQVHAIEDDAAGGRHGFAGEAVEERRLAGAVRADQTDDLALRQRRDRRPRQRENCRTPWRRFSPQAACGTFPEASSERGHRRCHNSNKPPGSNRAITTMMPP